MPDDLTKKEKHVTDLVGPDDRWVSVTDASRIGHRQEHTVRTWIAQGLLPVNPVRVGINKKTRQVRLSDLAKLTPIIDPDAGIATDLGTLDLPSIPKQQQQLMEQMTALQQDVAGQLVSLGEQFRGLAGEQEQFAEETRQTWRAHQQQYQALAHRNEELQQLIQQVRDTLAENLRSVDQAIRQELGNVLKLHELLDERVKAQDQAWKLAYQGLSNLVARTEQALRQALGEQVEQSAVALRQEWTGLLAQTEQTLRQESAGTVEGVRKDLVGQVDQLAAQLAGLQSTWQERATIAETEARQLRLDLDAQGCLQQALQKQLDEERKAREELARQVSKLHQQGQQKGEAHE